MKPKISTIIFDYAGVITKTQGFDRFISQYGKDYGKKKEDFYYIFKKNWPELSIGNGNPDSYWEELAGFLNENPKDIKSKLLSTFPLDKALLSQIKELKKKTKTVLMSNQIPGWIEHAFLPEKISDYFTENFSSYIIGIKKPNPDAYKYILIEMGVQAENCMYFDDQEENISAAKALGINSIQYTESTDFKTELSKFKLDI